jgi:thymidylate synthase (FAD)
MALLLAQKAHSSGISVELIESMGSDLSVVNAARVSYGKLSDWDWYIHCSHYEQFYKHGDNANRCSECEDLWHPTWKSEAWQPVLKPADNGLINYLMRERHGTPFEMVQFKFRVKVPIFVQREWMRHRIGSYNEISTRYVEFQPEFYVPEGEAWRKSVGKPGQYQMEPLSPVVARTCHSRYLQACDDAFVNYKMLLLQGCAREVARNVLPLATFTEFIWSTNLRSALNFLSLRTAPNALLEIQWAAGYVEELIGAVVPECMNAWRKHDKRCP